MVKINTKTIVIVIVIIVIAFIVWVSTAPQVQVDLAEKCIDQCNSVQSAEIESCLRQCKEGGLKK